MDAKNKEINYVMPFITMVFLFFVVGFLTTANSQFQAPLKEAFLSDAGNFKNTLATMITFSWFIAYPIFGAVGAGWVDRRGYKGTLLRGLFLMVFGLLLFFASSVFTLKFPAANIAVSELSVNWGFMIFLLGSFFVGSGATVLQVVINPYLTACTVRGTESVQRLSIGGTANSVGTTVAPYFVTGIVFGGLSMSEVSIDRIMIPFLCLAAIMLVVLFILSRIELPDIAGTRNDGGEKLEESVWSFSHLTLGVVAIFFYVGVEVCIGANINMYAIEKELPSPALLATIYWGAMLVGRALGSVLGKFSARKMLVALTSAATVLTLLAVILDNPWILAFVGLFHSIMWGCVFTLAVKGLGKYTSVASGVFMIGVVGGAVFPLIQGYIADAVGGWQYSWLLVTAGEVAIMLYALVGSKVRKSAE